MYTDRIHRRRILLGFLPLLVLCGLIGIRLVDLHILQGASYVGATHNKYTATVEWTAPRGRIFDRNGILLAGNSDRPTLFALPKAITRPKLVAFVLSPILNIPSNEILPALTSDRQMVYIKRHCSQEEVDKIEGLSIVGVGFRSESARTYPQGKLASHILGFTNIDNVGGSGAEAQLDAYLRGEKFKFEATLDGRGRMLHTLNLSENNPHNGSDVTLTLDSAIQHFTETALEAKCAETMAQSGSAVVLDVRTGEILACANWPTYNPNQYRTTTSDQRTNRAVTYLYEPGSVFKVATVLAALDEGVVSPSSLIDVGKGWYHVAGHTYRDDHPWKTPMTVEEITIVSSNVGAIKIAEMLGPEKYLEHIARMGFNGVPTVDVPGTAQMYFTTPASRGWSALSMRSMAFGGGEVMTSAMGMAALFNAVANDGILAKPRVVRSISRSVDGSQHEYRQSEPVRIASEKAARQMRSMMVQVVEHTKGTGKRAAVEGVRVFGKTGTCRKFDREIGAYSSRKILSSFGGSFPYENPRVTIFVSIDEPKTETYGGAVAAPVFKDIAERCVDYLGIPREVPAESAPPAPNPVLAMTRTEDVPLDRMPLVLGMSMGEAVGEMAARRIVPAIEGSGHVVYQNPTAGSPIAPGQSARLILASAPVN